MTLPLPLAGDLVAAAKQQLRLWIRNIRDSIPDDVAALAAHAAQRRLLAHPLARCSSVIALYASMGSELSTRALAIALRDRGAAVVYPRVNANDGQLAFHRVDSADALSPRTLGILEPAADAPVAIESIDAFIVPGLAFDRRGTRLGWGKGFYDRALSRNLRAARIGYAFEQQIIDEVPGQPWDVPMTHLVTQAGVRVCRHQPPGA